MTAADFGKPGTFKCKVKTINDYDGNLTEGIGYINISLLGKVSGTVDYSAGANYNQAEAAPIEGELIFTHAPDPNKWSRYEDDHTIYWAEKYHGGTSDFYYSGKFDPL